MAKKKADTEAASSETTAPETEPTSGAPQSNGGSTMGYFRTLFKANKGWLKERSNEPVLQRWLQDHPGETEVPEKVKQSLSNVKSLLRKTLSAKKARRANAEQPAQNTAPRQASARLEELEHSIDESLSLAKQIDREGLHEVIRHLRAARNRVVMQMGGE